MDECKIHVTHKITRTFNRKIINTMSEIKESNDGTLIVHVHNVSHCPRVMTVTLNELNTELKNGRNETNF